MSLWNSVLAGGITRLSLFRTNRPLASHATLKLISNFIGAALFEWISASAYNERARANDRQGLHLLILGSERSNARARLKGLNR
jgi:hypothetical protein